MNHQVSTSEAELLLRRADRRTRALSVLNGNAVPRFIHIVSAASVAFGVFTLSTFEAPLGVKILIAVGFGCAVVGAIEQWSLRRRLEAAIELIKALEHAGG